MNIPMRKSSTAAAVSLVFGALSWLLVVIIGVSWAAAARTSMNVSAMFGALLWFVLPIIGATIAIIAGRMARKEIMLSDGVLTGDGMAAVGVVLGWTLIGIVAIPVLGYIAYLVFLIATLPPIH